MKIKLLNAEKLNNKMFSKGTTLEVANFIGVPLVNSGKAIDLSGIHKKKPTKK